MLDERKPRPPEGLEAERERTVKAVLDALDPIGLAHSSTLSSNLARLRVQAGNGTADDLVRLIRDLERLVLLNAAMRGYCYTCSLCGDYHYAEQGHEGSVY